MHYFEFGNLIGQRTANRRAVFSLVSPEACCDVTEASTECNGAVARSRRFSDVMQALMECKWRRRLRGLGSILLQKVRSCCALTILYKTYSTVGRSIASI